MHNVRCRASICEDLIKARGASFATARDEQDNSHGLGIAM